MWVIVHSVSGMALGALLGPLGAGLPLWGMIVVALVAHALLDLVPHWDYTRRPHAWVWAVGDTGAALLTLLGAVMVWDAPGYVFWVGAVSAAPDLDVLDAVLPFKTRRRLFPSHWPTYPHGRARPLPGTLSQATVLVGSIVVLTLML